MNLNNFLNIVYSRFTEKRYKQDGVGGDGCQGDLWKKDSNKTIMRLSVMYSLEMVALEALGCQSWICWGFLWEWPAQAEQMVGNMYRRIVGILDKRYKILSCQAGGRGRCQRGFLNVMKEDMERVGVTEKDVKDWERWRQMWRPLNRAAKRRRNAYSNQYGCTNILINITEQLMKRCREILTQIQ